MRALMTSGITLQCKQTDTNTTFDADGFFAVSGVRANYYNYTTGLADWRAPNEMFALNKHNPHTVI